MLHSNKKITSTNDLSEKLIEENTTSLQKIKKLAAANVNDKNNESKILHIIKLWKIIDFTNDNVSYKVEILSRAAKFKNSFNIKCKDPMFICNQWGHINFESK